jgi:hypothetical protein
MEVQNDEIPLKELIEKEGMVFLFAFAMEGYCFGWCCRRWLGLTYSFSKPVYTAVCLALEDEKKVAMDRECPLVSEFNSLVLGGGSTGYFTGSNDGVFKSDGWWNETLLSPVLLTESLSLGGDVHSE